MILTYDAIDSEGHRTHDSIEATDTREGIEQLRSRGLYVTRIKAGNGEKSKNPKAQTLEVSDSKRLPLKVLVPFTRQMAMLLRSGSGLVPAIAAIKRQLSDPRQAALLGDIVASLEDGATLTDALRKHPRTFDGVYCAIIAAGEASATLTEMFDRLSSIVGKRRAMRKKILGACAYPALLVVMCSAIMLVLLLFVLPRFNTMFIELDVETPATTRMMLATGEALRHYWLLFLIGLGGLGLAVAKLLTSADGRQWLSNIQLDIPVLGRLRSRLIQGQVFRTMGMLLECRVGVLDALDLVRGSTRNSRYQRLFDRVEETVASGGHLSTALEESSLIEPYICHAIHTGEQSANLGGAISFCADNLDETNEELINVTMRLLEPAVLILMGLFVGGMAISLFLPLFDMTSAIR